MELKFVESVEKQIRRKKMHKVVRPLKAIRLKCLDCSGWQWSEIERCVHTDCILYPLRFGKKPKGVNYSKVSAKEYEKRINSRDYDVMEESGTVVEESQ